MEQKNGAATASTILGIVSLVIAVIGGITFGVIGAAIALILGIVAVVLKKTDRRHKRSGWFCLWFDWYYLCCYFCSRMFNLWCC